MRVLTGVYALIAAVFSALGAVLHDLRLLLLAIAIAICASLLWLMIGRRPGGE